MIKLSRHILLSSKRYSQVIYALIVSTGLLAAFSAVIIYEYPSLKLDTKIEGTWFAVLVAGIATIAGTLLKITFDLLDYDKKENEKKLEVTVNDLEKYYYPIAVASQGAAKHMLEILPPKLIESEFGKIPGSGTQAGNSEPEISKQISDILFTGAKEIAEVASGFEDKVKYSLFLVGYFYYQRFRVEAYKGGSIIIRDIKQEVRLMMIFQDLDDKLNWMRDGERIHWARSVLQYYFSKNDTGEERTIPCTFAEFSKAIDENNTQRSDLVTVYNQYKEWMNKSPDSAIVAAKKLYNLSVEVERVVRQLSSFWYDDKLPYIEEIFEYRKTKDTFFASYASGLIENTNNKRKLKPSSTKSSDI